MRRPVPWLLCLSVLVAPVASRAQGRNQYLEEGKRLIKRGQPGRAVYELRRGLDLPGLPAEQEIEILGWLGAAYQLSGQPAEAVGPWEERVRMAPHRKLASTLPKPVQDAYARVASATVIIQSLPPPGAFSGRPLSLTASLTDARHRTSDLLVYYRRAGEPDWQVAKLHRRGEDWHARIDLPPVVGRAHGYVLEYYLVAQAASGEVLHSLGGPTEPLTVKVAASPLPEPHEVGTEKITAVAVGDLAPHDDEPGQAPAHHGLPVWLWVVVGVVAAGAAVGGVALASGHGDTVPKTTLGAIHFPLEGGGR